MSSKPPLTFKHNSGIRDVLIQNCHTPKHAHARMPSLELMFCLCYYTRRQGVRTSEQLTVALLVMVVCCFLVDLILSKPPLTAVIGGMVPRMQRESVYAAVCLLGANVMPHNFYLVSDSNHYLRRPLFKTAPMAWVRGMVPRLQRESVYAAVCLLRGNPVPHNVGLVSNDIMCASLGSMLLLTAVALGMVPRLQHMRLY
eukprot:GHUV01044422.1.p1 GENE.GHUV01044422.1~~GHUV01044422.1.p1  ORF type:complete len:199 (+),score=2.78 GHUV01044422.1:132-728(+)